MAYNYKVYFTERPKNRVVRWDPDIGSVDVVAGGNAAHGPDQELHDPYGLAIDATGALLIADKLSHRVCRLTNSRIAPLQMRDVAGDRVPHGGRRPYSFRSVMCCPTGLWVEESGALLCAFSDDHTLYRIHPDGRLEHLLGILPNQYALIPTIPPDAAPEQLANTPLYGPTAVVKRRDGTIFFIERGYQTVREYHPQRGLRSLFPHALFYEWQFKTSAPETSRMEQYHPAFPSSLALDSDENLFISDVKHRCVLKADLKTGVVERVLETNGPKPGGPAAIRFDANNVAWVLDSSAGAIGAYNTGKSKWSATPTVLRHVASDPISLHAAGAGLVLG